MSARWLLLAAVLAAPLPALARPKTVTVVYRDLPAVDWALESKRLDLQPPPPAPLPLARGLQPLAVSDLSSRDHDVVIGGILATRDIVRNPISVPLRRSLAAVSADGRVDENGARARVDVVSASTVARCVNRFAYAIRCIVLVDIAGSVTGENGVVRPVIASAERASAAVRPESLAQVVELVSAEAADAFARAVATPLETAGR